MQSWAKGEILSLDVPIHNDCHGFGQRIFSNLQPFQLSASVRHEQEVRALPLAVTSSVYQAQSLSTLKARRGVEVSPKKIKNQI